jgi:hypothetical protein
MWTAAKQTGKALAKAGANARFLPRFDHSAGSGNMWVEGG